MHLLRPTLERPVALALLSAVAPAILMALYFAAVGLTVGMAWPVEVWTGSVLLAGAVGLALSIIVIGAALREGRSRR
jgi:hypothetical protein